MMIIFAVLLVILAFSALLYQPKHRRRHDHVAHDSLQGLQDQGSGSGWHHGDGHHGGGHDGGSGDGGGGHH